MLDDEEDNNEDLDEDDSEGREPNISLITYLGFCLISLGLCISAVVASGPSLQTAELQLFGPTLLGLGVSFIILKVLQCNALHYALHRDTAISNTSNRTHCSTCSIS